MRSQGDGGSYVVSDVKELVPLVHVEQVEPPTTPKGSIEFVFLGRTCTGNDIHDAVVRTDLRRVQQILAQRPDAVHERFSYETAFKGRKQEGSGVALHLAVSRKSMEITKLLLEHDARLDAMVTRDNKPHYDVLHAAIFAEGSGGSEEMVRYLLSKGAKLTKNADQHSVLHKAFQVGSIPLINLLRNEMQATDPEGLVMIEEDVEGPLDTPLQKGIQMGKLTEQELAKLAPRTCTSMHIFIRDEPRVVPEFLPYLLNEPDLSAGVLAEKINMKDLARLLRSYPSCGLAILEAITDEPVCTAVGYHPLPTRMSFEPQGLFENIKSIFNINHNRFAFMEDTVQWDYNTVDFKEPEWHEKVLRRKRGKQMQDVSIKVCHLQGIGCAEFLIPIVHGTGGSEVFEQPVIQALLYYLWWGDSSWWTGAWRRDLLQVCLTLYCLALMLTETLLKDEVWLFPGCAQPRRLVRSRSGVSDTLGAHPHHEDRADDDDPCVRMLATEDFLVVRGIIDLVQEVIQFSGYHRLGHGWDYLTAANNLDLMRSITAIMYRVAKRDGWTRTLVVLITWMRLLEFSSEKLQRELLPIIRLSKGLIFPLIVLIVGYLAFTHAWITLNAGTEPIWPDAIHKTFEMLVTAGLPEIPANGGIDNTMANNLVFSYAAVLLFTIFFLNIFIGVIGDAYSNEKERVAQSYQELRARQCCAMLLREEVCPIRMFRPCLVVGISVFAAGSLLAVQVLQVIHVLAPSIWVTIFLMFDLILLTVAAANNEHTRKYLWFVKPFRADEDTGSQLNRVEKTLDVLVERVDTVQTSSQAPQAGQAETSSRLDRIESKMETIIRRLDALGPTSAAAASVTAASGTARYNGRAKGR